MHVLVVYITIHGPVTADAIDDLEDIIFNFFQPHLNPRFWWQLPWTLYMYISSVQCMFIFDSRILGVYTNF